LKKKLAKEKTKNSKLFYAYLKGHTKSRTTVGPLKDKDKNTISSNEGMAEELNKFLASVFSREGPEPVPEADQMEFGTRLESSTITEKKIKEKIRNLRPNSAAGPDRIGPNLLQNIQEEVAPALRIIFRRSMDEREVPEDWSKVSCGQL
jgi:hypothetical protein